MRKNRNRSAVSVLKLNKFKITTLQMVMWLLVFMVGLSMLLIMNPTNINLGIKGNNAVAIGTAEAPDYTISDVEDLMAFAEKRQSTTSGQDFSSAWGISSNPKYILLTQDITLDVTTWTPIGGSSSSTRFYSIFDGGIYSYQEHIIKPDKRIYNLLIDKYNLKRSETIFFDDKEKNVISAINQGISSYVFKSIEDIKNNI